MRQPRAETARDREVTYPVWIALAFIGGLICTIAGAIGATIVESFTPWFVMICGASAMCIGSSAAQHVYHTSLTADAVRDRW